MDYRATAPCLLTVLALFLASCADENQAGSATSTPALVSPTSTPAPTLSLATVALPVIRAEPASLWAISPTLQGMADRVVGIAFVTIGPVTEDAPAAESIAGLPRTTYRAEVDWLSGGHESARVRFVGGQVENVTMEYEGLPLPVPCERYVLFLKAHADDPGQYSDWIVRFRVVDGRLDEGNMPGTERSRQFAGKTVEVLRPIVAGLTFRNGVVEE